MKTRDWIELSIHISIHCVVVVLFLTSFFFFYVYRIEASTLENDIRDIVQRYTESIMSIIHSAVSDLDPTTIDEMRGELDFRVARAKELARTARDEIRRRYHKSIAVSYSIIGGITVVAIVWNGFLLWRHPRAKINFRKIVISIYSSLVLIVAIEISFFFLVARRLKVMTPEILISDALTSFQQLVRRELVAPVNSTTSPPL